MPDSPSLPSLVTPPRALVRPPVAEEPPIITDHSPLLGAPMPQHSATPVGRSFSSPVSRSRPAFVPHSSSLGNVARPAIGPVPPVPAPDPHLLPHTPVGGVSLSRSATSPPAPPRGQQRTRISPLNSGLWISIEVLITLSQVIAAVVVLILTRKEHPQVPLRVYAVGYAAGCLATLPILRWRYQHRYSRTATQAAWHPDTSSPSQALTSVVVGDSSHATVNASTAQEGTLSHTGQVGPVDSSRGPDAPASTPPPAASIVGSSQVHPLPPSGSAAVVSMERFKIALDCFFAVWFVVGNVWLFGGHATPQDAPHLYRLCLAFLVLSYVGYALPFVFCATVCCCLPCIIAVMGLAEEPLGVKGAPQAVIRALPTYAFRTLSGKEQRRASKPPSSRDAEEEAEGKAGVLAAGTPQERTVAEEDAVCSICLGQYSDGVELRELPCLHHFHTACVDKWLAINASCPLCKLDISRPPAATEAQPLQTIEIAITSGEGAEL